MTQSKLYKRHRFPAEIIQYAVWLYHRFSLSHRDIEDLLAQRGIEVSYEAVRHCRRRFTIHRNTPTIELSFHTSRQERESGACVSSNQYNKHSVS
jgi:transposase-like protein